MVMSKIIDARGKYKGPRVNPFKLVGPNGKEVKNMPHCDPRILHAPGDCQVCDMYPDLQEARIRMMINFTNRQEENHGPCPADFLRGDTKEAWPGNRPIESEDE